MGKLKSLKKAFPGYCYESGKQEKNRKDSGNSKESQNFGFMRCSIHLCILTHKYMLRDSTFGQMLLRVGRENKRNILDLKKNKKGGVGRKGRYIVVPYQ